MTNNAELNVTLKISENDLQKLQHKVLYDMDNSSLSDIKLIVKGAYVTENPVKIDTLIVSLENWDENRIISYGSRRVTRWTHVGY